MKDNSENSVTTEVEQKLIRSWSVTKQVSENGEPVQNWFVFYINKSNSMCILRHCNMVFTDNPAIWFH